MDTRCSEFASCVLSQVTVASDSPQLFFLWWGWWWGRGGGRGLKCNQFIPKTSWPDSQINQLVRVHGELRARGQSSDEDDAADDDGGGTVGMEAAAPSSCYTNLWLNSGCVCPTGFFLTPKLSHAFWSPRPPPTQPSTHSTHPRRSNLHEQRMLGKGLHFHRFPQSRNFRAEKCYDESFFAARVHICTAESQSYLDIWMI